MGSKMKTQQDEDDVSSDRAPEVALLMESLTEAQRLANDLKVYLQLDQYSSSMDPLPALVEGMSESLSRAIMLLLQSQSTGRWSLLMVPAPARRGSHGYKRRTQVSQGCRKELRSSMDDGYSWRKYGQKEIFAAKYPRSYFRCKHKYEQLCPATRQVQQSEADPSMLEITYIGDHTCCTQQPPHPSTMASGSTALASYTSSIIVKHEDAPPLSAEKVRRDHQAPADHDDSAPVHRLDLDGSFPCVTAGDLQMKPLELGGQAYGNDLIFDARCYTTDTYYTAAGDDDELAAAASSFGDFTSTSTSAMIWELISTNNISTDH